MDVLNPSIMDDRQPANIARRTVRQTITRTQLSTGLDNSGKIVKTIAGFDLIDWTGVSGMDDLFAASYR